MKCEICKGYGYKLVYTGNGFPNLVQCEVCGGSGVVEKEGPVVQEEARPSNPTVE
jgi:DnaJ-class molecular chaperone